MAELEAALLLRLYREMVRLRRLDERLGALVRQGRIGFYGAALGQEAVPVAAALAIDERDWIFPALRESGAIEPTSRDAAAGECSGCGGRTDPDDQFCMHCGKQLVSAVRRCGKCGAFPSPGDNFCMFCGHTLIPRKVDRAGAANGTDLRA